MPQRRHSYSSQSRRPARAHGSRASSSARRPSVHHATARRRSVKEMKARRSTPEGLASGLGLGSFSSMDDARKPAISRRAFLAGAGALGAVGAIAVGTAVLGGSSDSQDGSSGSAGSSESGAVSTLSVPADSVLVLSSDSEDFSAADDASAYLTLIASYDLDFGTVLWCSNETNAACLLPKQTADPLTGLGVLDLQTGDVTELLERAVADAEGFEIYDARASEEGIVWTEANILAGTWRLMSAELTAGGIGTPALVDSGNADWEMPSLAAVGSRALWQCNPKADGAAEDANSCVKCANFGSENVAVLVESAGTMPCPLYATADAVVCAPRLAATGTYYQLTCLDAASGAVVDTLTLPAAMTPLEVGYGPAGFAFSFESSYSYGDGIANMGTYAPMDGAAGESYEGRTWVRYARTPSAPPAWCGPYLMMKAPVYVTGVDLAARTSFSPDTDSGCDDWGEFLATTGAHGTVVTYTSIVSPGGGAAASARAQSGESTGSDAGSGSGANAGSGSQKVCRVKVYAPASSGIEGIEPEEDPEDSAGDESSEGSGDSEA